MHLHELLGAENGRATFTAGDLAAAAKKVGFCPPTQALQDDADAYFRVLAEQRYTVRDLESALYILSLPARSHYPHAAVAVALHACLARHGIVL